MAKDPALLVYTQNALVGCAEFTDQEFGQYWRILFYMHQKGRMSEETIRLLVGIILPKVRLKFDIDESGLLFNKVMEEVIEKRKKFIISRINNGLLGGRPKANGKANQKLNESYLNEDENENINTNKDNKKKKHLFSESEFFEFEKFSTEMGLKGWPVGKSAYYHQAMLDWSDGITSAKKNPQKAIDWIRTALAWERRDKQEGKGYYKDKKTEGTGRKAEIL